MAMHRRGPQGSPGLPQVAEIHARPTESMRAITRWGSTYALQPMGSEISDVAKSAPCLAPKAKPQAEPVHDPDREQYRARQ